MIWGLLALLAASALLFLAGLIFWIWSRDANAPDQADLRLRVLGLEAAPDPRATWQQSGPDDPVLRFVCTHLWRAGIHIEASLIARAMGVGVVLVIVIVLVLGLAAGLTVVAIGGFLAVGYVSRRAARRQRILTLQLPDFLEHVTRSLSAGNSLEESMAEACGDCPEPLHLLFVSVTRQVRLGAPVDDVLYETARLHQLDDLRVMAMAARVNRRYGGSLKRIFKSLIQSIRERDAASRELRALTAETRISAITLAAVPIGIMLYILIQNPDYYQDMWADSFGRGLLLTSLIMQAAGVAVIWRMMQSAEEQPT